MKKYVHIFYYLFIFKYIKLKPPFQVKPVLELLRQQHRFLKLGARAPWSNGGRWPKGGDERVRCLYAFARMRIKVTIMVVIYIYICKINYIYIYIETIYNIISNNIFFQTQILSFRLPGSPKKKLDLKKQALSECSLSHILRGALSWSLACCSAKELAPRGGEEDG